MTTQLIITNAETVKVSISNVAIDQKNNALAASKKITSVTDDASQQLAIDTVRPMKKLLKEIESSRKEIKKPLIDLGKQIDALAEMLSVDLQKEVNRILPMSDAYQSEKERKAREAQEKLDAENRRLQAEKEKAAKKGDEKKVVEISAQQSVTPTIAPVKVTKAEGSSNVKVPKFIILNLDLVYKHRPDLCKLEINTAAVNDAIRQDEKVEIPGLKTWTETQSRVRS